MNGSPDPRLDRLTAAPDVYRDIVKCGWKQSEPLQLDGPVHVQRDPNAKGLLVLPNLAFGGRAT